LPENQERGCKGCQETHEGEEVGIGTFSEEFSENIVKIGVKSMSDFVADHLLGPGFDK
jgi:hypothetical protein